MKTWLRALLFSLALPAAAMAQTWPARPVKIILANSPGAATDLVGRVFTDSLSRAVGRPVTIENRPGADGYIGAQAVASSPPDGYTLFFGSQSVFALDPNIKKVMPVDPVKDFTAIAVAIDDTGATGLFAHPSNPFRTFNELIAYGKANPGKLTVATTVPLFGMLNSWINHRAGTNITEIRYKTTAQANQDALSGQVTLILSAFGPFEGFVKAEKVRTLVVSRPVEGYDIPSLASFYPEFNQPSFVVLAGPAGMPAELVQRINRATAGVVEAPNFNRDLASIRWRNVEGARTPEGTVEFIRRNREAWGKFVQEIGMKPE